MKTPANYAALLAVSAARSLPRRFSTDLTRWDREALAVRDVAEPFLWCLRDDGTHLVFADERDNARPTPHTAPDYPAMLAEVFGAAACHWLWWDGAELRELAGERAVEAATELLREAARVEKLATAAAVYVPKAMARVLARSVLAALHYGEADLAAEVANVVAAYQRPRAGGWTWPDDLAPELVANAMIRVAS